MNIEEALKQLEGVALHLSSGVILIGLVILRRWLKKTVVDPLMRLLKKEMEDEGDPFDYLKSGKNIYEAIVELRIQLNADRVHVVQFHNGDRFAAHNPIWKMTCTHETCREGVSYEAYNLQAVQVSQFSKELSALWCQGWKENQKAGPCAAHGKISHEPGIVCRCYFKDGMPTFRVVVIKWSDLNPSYFKTVLAARGTVYGVSVPIFVEGDIVGYVAVDYTGSQEFEKVIEYDLSQACLTADRITYYLKKQEQEAP